MADTSQAEADDKAIDFSVIEVPVDVDERQHGRFREIAGILLKSDLVKGPTPERVRAVIEQLGPTYVKIGQIMSMRPDMIPKEYCDELAKLRTDVAPMTLDQVREVLEETYGAKISSIFKEVDEKPLGSASIAQAHSATLKDGSRVCLKIQRPGIYKTMAEDIALLRRAAQVVKIAGGGGLIDFGAMVDEMWAVAQDEMDFMVEARNNAAFAEYNEDEQRIECPHIYTEYSTGKVLVMEYIDGISVGKPDAVKAKGWDTNDLCTLLVNNYIKQCIEDGFFHADPHPGNIWVRDDKIVWIDMGMMGHLSRKDRKLIGEAIFAVANKDTNALKDVVLSLGVYKGRIDHPRLYADIDEYLQKYGSLDLESIDMGSAFDDLMAAAKNNGISIPASITLFGRGIATLEGTVQVLCPSINLVSIFSSHMEQTMMKDFDPVAKLKDMTIKLYNSGSKSVEIPGLASDLMKMMMRGQVKVNMQVEGSSDLADIWKRSIDKVVGGLIVAAFLIGSSFLCTTNMEPKILGVPALGAVGFIVALGLGLWLVWESHKKK